MLAGMPDSERGRGTPPSCSPPPALRDAAWDRARNRRTPGPSPTATGWDAAFALDGPVARGEQGEIWRLETEDGRGRSSVTSGFPTLPRRHGRPPLPGGRPGRRGPRACGGPLHHRGRPRRRRRRAGQGVRLARPRRARPDGRSGGGGEVVAAVHRVRHDAGIPVHPWYSEPVGAAAWDDLVAALSAAAAPFSRRARRLSRRTGRHGGPAGTAARLQTCHRDLWSDSILGTDDGLCVIDWENCGLADPSQELAMVLFEFGMGDPCHSRRLRRSRGAGTGRTSRHVLDGHRHSGAHRVPARPDVARSRQRVRPCHRRHGRVSRRTAADGRRGHVHPRRRHRRLTRPRRQSSGSRGVGGRVSSRARSEH